MRHRTAWKRVREHLPPPLYAALAELLRQYRTIGIILALELAAVTLLGAGLAVIAADWILVLSRWCRYVLRDVIALGAATATVAVLAARFRPLSPARWALSVEKLLPAMKGRLATAAELASTASGPSRMMNFISGQAERVIAGTPAIEIPLAPLRKPGMTVGLLAVAALTWWAVAGSRFERAVMRLLFPGSGIAAPTQLTISDVQPGNVRIRRGDVLRASCATAGGEVEEIFLVIRAGGDDLRILGAPDETGRYSAVSPPLDRSGIYFFEAPAKTRSDEFRVEALPPARVTSVRFVINPPEYTGRDSYEMGADPVVLESSGISVTAFTNRPAFKGILHLGEREIPLKSTPDGLSGQFSLTGSSTSYTVRFVDSDGFPSEDLPPHLIAVKTDRPPEPSITAPAQGDSFEPGSSIPVFVKVFDDYGVASASLDVSSADTSQAPPVTKELPRLKLQPGREPGLFVGAVPPEYLPRVQGTLSLTPVAADNCPFRLQEARGKPVSIQISGASPAGGDRSEDERNREKSLELLATIDELAAARNRTEDPHVREEIDKTLDQALQGLEQASEPLASADPALRDAIDNVSSLVRSEAPYRRIREAVHRVRTILSPDTRPLTPEDTFVVTPSAGDSSEPVSPPDAKHVEQLPDPPGLSEGYKRLMKVYRRLSGEEEP
ncbi:MAG: hypothetical protein JW909_12150 [Planctomycetes bacterium]|nr:hypothetical protein [Planctomycetota bacterium]